MSCACLLKRRTTLMTATATRTNQSRPVPLRGALSFALISLVIIYGLWVTNQEGYAPGSPTGYRLGLYGALMMLLLLLYPLRKHISLLRNFGRLSEWLQMHMLLGVGGPVLILFHSGFGSRSMNAAVALWCMIIVASSGVIGRFIYGRIHSRLNGQKLAAAELNRDLGKLLVRIERDGALPQRVREMLAAFEARVAQQPDTVLRQTIRFLRVASERRSVFRAVRREMALTMDARRCAQVEASLRPYLRGLQRVSQFAVYERMFALWHVLHLPLVALLVVSVIFHVIAVHMY